MTAPFVMPVDVTDPARIAERALATLGSTPRAVAASLAAAGFTGRVESADDCPIARYLRATDPRLTAVIVLGDGIQLDLPAESVTIPIPDPVLWFVTRFDHADLPHLIDTSPQLDPLADPGTTIRKEDRP
ncbi:hypothetical protein ACQP2F_08605 [Actinoplanes sp. CA-030573]|uniref:hypothetical protein n=1 Tax=Actinoplanes sp. CA-030573 TaxID=3239898 RepID=UPI003D89C68B